MSVDFRQRKPAEYAKIVWKRKWLILLPAIAIASSIAWVVANLPNVYESTTLLIVKLPTISNSVVPTLSDVDLSMRINNIGQLVSSRSSLEPLILRYDLYHEDRQNGDPMEVVVEQMRKDITVEVDKSRNDVTNAFRISFKEHDPHKTQVVTAELATRYVSEQINSAIKNSAATTDFFDRELAEVKSQLDDVDHQRLQYMTQHVGTIPSTVQSLIGQLTGLREEQKSLISEIGRLRENRTAAASQLNEFSEESRRAREIIVRQEGDVKTTPAYGQLIVRKSALESDLQNMLTQLKPQNPDVKQKQAELDSVKRELRQMEDDAKARTREIEKERASYPDLRVSGVKTTIKSLDADIQRAQTMLDQNSAQLAEVEQRINGAPTTEVGLASLNSDYQTKKTQYDSLLERQQKAKMSSDLSTNQQGETLQVIDPANMPQKPVAPRRSVLILLGSGLGLAVGLFFAAAFEVPRLLTIQSKEDAEHYTRLPVLVSLPELLTSEEQRKAGFRRAFVFAACVIVTIISIPLLVMILNSSHFFDRFV